MFWLDLETTQRKFASVYNFLRYDILSEEKLWKGSNTPTEKSHSLSPRASPVILDYSDTPNTSNPTVPSVLLVQTTGPLTSYLGRYVVDFFLLVARFVFYYEDPESLPHSLPPFISFIQERFEKSQMEEINIEKNSDKTHQQEMTNLLPSLTDITQFASGSEHSPEDPLIAGDLFVGGVVRHMQYIKNEDVLIRYLKCCTFLAPLKMSDTSRARLQHTLYIFSSPGGPIYAPRPVRHVATSTLDTLFPSGKLGRDFIKLCFRLLHPYYSTGSVIHWVYSRIKPYVYFFGENSQE